MEEQKNNKMGASSALQAFFPRWATEQAPGKKIRTGTKEEGRKFLYGNRNRYKNYPKRDVPMPGVEPGATRTNIMIWERVMLPLHHTGFVLSDAVCWLPNNYLHWWGYFAKWSLRIRSLSKRDEAIAKWSQERIWSNCLWIGSCVGCFFTFLLSVCFCWSLICELVGNRSVVA